MSLITPNGRAETEEFQRNTNHISTGKDPNFQNPLRINENIRRNIYFIRLRQILSYKKSEWNRKDDHKL